MEILIIIISLISQVSSFYTLIQNEEFPLSYLYNDNIYIYVNGKSFYYDTALTFKGNNANPVTYDKTASFAFFSLRNVFYLIYEKRYYENVVGTITTFTFPENITSIDKKGLILGLFLLFHILFSSTL